MIDEEEYWEYEDELPENDESDDRHLVGDRQLAWLTLTAFTVMSILFVMLIVVTLAVD